MEQSVAMIVRLLNELELIGNGWEARRSLEADRLKMPLLENKEWG